MHQARTRQAPQALGREGRGTPGDGRHHGKLGFNDGGCACAAAINMPQQLCCFGSDVVCVTEEQWLPSCVDSSRARVYFRVYL